MRQRDKKHRIWVCLYRKPKVTSPDGVEITTFELIESRRVREHRQVQTFFQLDKKGKRLYGPGNHYFVSLVDSPGYYEAFTIEFHG